MPEVNLQIPILDLVIIITYMLGILAVGVLSTRHQKLTGDLYFLAGRSLGWVMVGAALFASNISTIHIVGLAASGYNVRIGLGEFRVGRRLHADYPGPGIRSLLLPQPH